MTGPPIDLLERRRKAPFRLCLDLNVWCSVVLSAARGRQTTGTATGSLVDAVRRGTSALGPMQLVVSWEMLDRLGTVLARCGFSRPAVETALAEIALIARIGPAETAPLVVLGGTAVLPLRDVEDVHVLEVAISGRARVLATANFRDFVNHHTRVVKPGRIAVYNTADHEVIIAHPDEAAAWVRTGEIRLG